MKTFTVIGHPKPEAGWVHRFRNLGEDVYVRLRATLEVNIAGIDAAFDEFHVGAVGDQDARGVMVTLTDLVRAHNLSDSVFVRDDAATVTVRKTVVLALDPDLGEQLWEVVGPHPMWVVGSEKNKAAVKEMRAATALEGRPDVTVWSNQFEVVTEDDWRGVLNTLDMHHGELASKTPLNRLNVYGATLTPAAAAALCQFDFHTWMTTPSGFIALME